MTADMSQRERDRDRFLLVAVLTGAACFFTYYFHVILGSGTVVTHFYYIPIILACLWWRRWGLAVALFLAAFLLLSHLFLRSHVFSPNDYLRAPMFLVVGLVVVTLAEKIAKAEQALRKAHDDLEKRVEERTAQLGQANQELKEEIEHRKRFEERLKRTAKELEKKNEEIKKFAYIVSHDLRAPLINLKGFAAELRGALRVLVPPLSAAMSRLDETERSAITTALQDVPEALGFIDSSVTRMDELINAVLLLSRLGRRELKLETVDMNVVVLETLQTLGHQIEQNGVKITSHPLPEVTADRLSMQQIMGNLLSNALLYLDPSRAGVIEIKGDRTTDQTTFCVKDNGRGIAERDMDKVFAPFRRAGRQDAPGEGMGLSYAQTLVDRHGGRIWCTSEQGVGTMFCFAIPHHWQEERKDYG